MLGPTREACAGTQAMNHSTFYVCRLAAAGVSVCMSAPSRPPTIETGVAAVTSQLMATDRDLHTMLRIVLAPDRDDEPTEGVPWSVLFELKELIPCNEIWFNGHDVEHEEQYFEQNTTPVEARPNSTEEIFWLHYWDSMCSYPDRTGDLRSIT